MTLQKEEMSCSFYYKANWEVYLTKGSTAATLDMQLKLGFCYVIRIVGLQYLHNDFADGFRWLDLKRLAWLH